MDTRRLIPLALALTCACGDSTSPPQAASVGLNVPSEFALDFRDSVTIESRALDAESAGVGVSVTWSVSDTALLSVSRVVEDSAGLVSRATLVARGRPGHAVVRVDAGSARDSMDVWVIARSAFPPGSATLEGRSVLDTLDGTPISAPDTLVIQAPALTLFDSSTTVILGGTRAVIRRTASMLWVVSSRPFDGRPVVVNVSFDIPPGTPLLGDGWYTRSSHPWPSADHVVLARVRFRGGVYADSSALGPRTVLRIVPAGGMQFSAASAPAVTIGGRAQRIWSWGTLEGDFWADSAWSTGFQVSNVYLNGIRLDSVWSAAKVTLGLPTLPLPVSVGAGRLMDTIRVYAIPGVAFGYPPYSGPTPWLDVAGSTALAFYSSADSVTGLAPRAVTSLLSVYSVTWNGVWWPRLFVPGAITLDPVVSGEPDEPANDAMPGATALAWPSDRVGAVSETTDHDDWFTFTLASPSPVSLTLVYAGDRRGSSGNPHLDLSLYRSPCAAADLRRSTVESYGDVITDNLPAGTWCVRVNAGAGADRLHTYILRLR